MEKGSARGSWPGGNFCHSGILSFCHLDRRRRSKSLVNVVISVIILEIIVQSLLASLSSSQEDDERDLLIERISLRNGYVCLSVGIWIWIGHTTIPSWWVWLDAIQSPLPEALVPVLLLLLFVIAEVTVTVTRLFYYRRGF